MNSVQSLAPARACLPRGGMTEIKAMIRAHLSHQPSGKYGVHNLMDLRSRCRVDEITDCWHWGMGKNGQGMPSLWLPAVRRRVTVGVALCVLITGKEPPKGIVWHVACETPNCCNPLHRKIGTRSTQMLQAPVKSSPMRGARISAAKRAQSKLTEADVQAIRDSTETLVVLATRYGVDMTSISKIRLGQSWRPIEAPNASVFSWRPAA